MSKKFYENIIIGAGIAGCSLGYFLGKKSDSVLLIDKNEDVAFGASGAAGAFLSPLLGKPNLFKDLVTKALVYSTNFYKEYFFEDIINCGTCRIPKNDEDLEKFNSYNDFMDFEYEVLDSGYFFKIGSVVNSYNVCKKLSVNLEKKFDYMVNKISKQDSFWVINDELVCKNIFLTTGANIDLLIENYIDIRAVWGQKIDILSSSEVLKNYHKDCSLSISKKFGEKNFISIGATHNRFSENMDDTSFNLNLKNINKINHNEKTLKYINEDSKKLLTLANDIKKLDDVQIVDVKIGARSSSVDYFPIVGNLVDSKRSINLYPHIKNGSFIKDEKLIVHENFYILNGLGGRGFVFSPYLANELVNYIYDKKELSKDISSHRMFKRWVKRKKD